ncbi:MAG TPA: outer membrane beta-barrel protein [Catalimonadaceae bacterium]|nr:outer membrane beta-barrel protein [Catalimonadaceae bacterium]
MKTKVILFSILLVSSFSLLAQENKFKLGIRFAPMIAFNKIADVDDKDSVAFESNGAGLRFSAGFFGDFHFGKNYAFHTGLWYTVNRSAAKYTSPKYGNGESVYNLQMLQIPIALKLFTNEIAQDMKLYFTLGGTIAVKINEKRIDWSSDNGYFERPGSGKAFSLGDIGLLLGMGTEYQMAENTILYGGIVYNRGLIDAMSKDGLFPKGGDNRDAKDYFTLNNQLLGLELGIKF